MCHLALFVLLHLLLVLAVRHPLLDLIEIVFLVE